MITFKYLSLQDFINPYSKITPSTNKLEAFKENIEEFFSDINHNSSEEGQKNEINELLKKSFNYKVNVKERIDSAIRIDGEIQAIIEAKSLDNKNEFPKSKDNPSSKALNEAILYFLREHIKNGNNSLKHIIICNAYEFFVFNANGFLQFKNDKKISQYYKNCDDKEGNDSRTQKFYDDLGEYLAGDFTGELAYTYFDLRHYTNPSDLLYIYQLLSPQVLLKQRLSIDANTLNQKFYDELLYILGLKEISKDGKVLINFSGTTNSMSYAIKNQFHNINDEDIFTLIITWNNRLLFIRLLESMLLSFKHISKPFLDTENIKDFSALQNLFFEVLAKRDRENVKLEFKNIPYLNSSLFDKISLEHEGKEIKLLNNDNIKIFQNSILKEDKNYKDKSSLPLLDYFFSFLHAYNFTTTAKDIVEGVKQNHDKLINSAVLGLVFEKLNGYKEGSFYTPSFITSYMCNDSITKAVIAKFNNIYGFSSTTLDEVKESIRSHAKDNKRGKEEYFKTLKAVKICDPAVGSGHFLVSALNELIIIAYKLDILSLPVDTNLDLDNDEILIHYAGEIFTYEKPNTINNQKHQIQQALFEIKKQMIESCLFGVDINPNSCEITKLRLWVELLKYSYYIFKEGKVTNDLETLPNIDINIKCGDSLISNFDINATKEDLIKNIKKQVSKSGNLNFVKDHQEVLELVDKKLANKIKEYKKAVTNYKDPTNNHLKPLYLQTMEESKEFILNLFSKISEEYIEFRDALYEYLDKYGHYGIYEATSSDGGELDFAIKTRLNHYAKNIDFNKNTHNENIDQKDTDKVLRALEKYEAVLENKNAFEWRFEFPEVLNDDGDFMGFDLIIGNPPYGVISTEAKEKLNSKSSDTAQLFILRASDILTPNGTNAFIVPKALTFAVNWQQIRDFLKNEVSHIIDCGRAWSYVLLEMVIFIRTQNQKCNTYITGFLNADSTTSEITEIDKKFIDLFGLFLNDISIKELEIGIKIKNSISNSLGKCGHQSRGGTFTKYIVEDTEEHIVLGGKEIQRYFINNQKGFISKTAKTTRNALIQKNSVLMQRLIAHIVNPLPHIKMTGTILNSGTKNIKIVETIYQIICSKDFPNYYILGLLHSKFLNWYCYNFVFAKAIRTFQFSNTIAAKIPIPTITLENQNIANEIISLVKKALNLKTKNKDADIVALEKQIDYLVYDLYSINEEEIKIINGEAQDQQ